MSLSETLQKQAEEYLDSNMSSIVKMEFELLMKDNHELRNYVAVNQEMRIQYNEEDWSFEHDNSDVDKLENFLKSKEALELKESLKTANDIFLKSKPTPKKSYVSFMAVAASIVILMGYFTFFKPLNNMELYSKYNDWSNLPSLTTRGDSGNSLLVKGEEAFLKKNYNLSKELFESYSNSNKATDPNALLYLGISNLELENYDIALTVFNDLIISNTLDSSKGLWYKGLVYLKMNDIKSAKKVFALIVKDSSNFNFAEAKSILEKLD